MKLDHVAFYVEDIDKAADWLVKYYGGEKGRLSENPKTGHRHYTVRFPNGAGIEVMSSPAITEKTEQIHPGLGYHHTAISVGGDEKYEALIKELADDGYRFLTGPRINSFGGKEGIVIGEGGNLTIQTTPGRKGADNVSVLNHIGFYVADNKEFAKFFVKYLNASDNGCSAVNPKTGQDNYMVGFDNGVSVELMTCPDMIPEIENRYQKLGYSHMAIHCDSEAQYDGLIASLKADGYQFLTEPRVNSNGKKTAVAVAPGNIALELVCPLS